MPIGSTISSLIAIQRVSPSISCPSYRQKRSVTRAFLYLDCQYSYRPTYFSNRIYLQSFPLTSQSIPVKVLDRYQINPRSLSRYLRSLTLTILRFSLRTASLKFRSTLYYYQSAYTSSYPLASYQKRSSSLLYLQYLRPLV